MSANAKGRRIGARLAGIGKSSGRAKMNAADPKGEDKALTLKQASDLLGVSTRQVSAALRAGIIKGAKVRRRWHVAPAAFAVFRKRNGQEIEKLRAEYVSLYRQGLNPDQLQRRVKKDFQKRRIVFAEKGFAERAIYEFVMAEKRKMQGKETK